MLSDEETWRFPLIRPLPSRNEGDAFVSYAAGAFCF